jgi:hypothetical protein
MRRIAGAAAIAAGLFLLAVPFATDLFDRTRGADRTFDAMRDTISEPGIALARRNFGTVEAGGKELLGEAIPGLARRLGLSSEEFTAQIRRDYPDVARATGNLPGYLTFVGPTIDALDANRDKFEAGESLPGGGLPITASPWLFLLLGGLVAGAGVYALRTPGRRGLVPVAVLGAAAVALPLAFGIPSKASDARDIGDIARGGLSQQGADKAEEIVVVLDGMVQQVRGAMVPDLARRLGVTPSDVEAKIARDYPSLSLLLERWEAIAAGDTGAKLAATQQAVVDDFAQADETPVLELPWLVIGPGGLLLIVAGAGLLSERARGANARPSPAPSAHRASA